MPSQNERGNQDYPNDSCTDDRPRAPGDAGEQPSEKGWTGQDPSTRTDAPRREKRTDGGADVAHAGTGGLGEGAKQLLRAHIDEFRAAGLTEGPFRLRDFDEETAPPLKALLDTPAIVRVGDADGGNSGRSPPGVYRLRAAAVTYLDQQAELRWSPCPCGHGGLRNLGAAYTCTFEGCDRRFDREELEGSS